MHKFRERFNLPGCTVTFLDANHCPGSAMILFDVLVGGRTHLHCGDMRFCQQILQEPRLVSSKIDRLYLVSVNSQIYTQIYWVLLPNPTFGHGHWIQDTTFAHPKHSFPSQEHTIQCIIQLVHETLNQHVDNCLIFIG